MDNRHREESVKKLSIALCSLLCGVCCWGTDISFQVVQHNDALDTVCEQTLVIEDQILDYFFNFGDIVTNEPAVAIVPEAAENLWRTAYAFAVTGGADYFVELRLFYSGKASRDPAHISLKDLERVSWTIADVKTGKKIAEAKAKVRKPASGKTDAAGVKEYAASIAEAMRKAIRKDIDKKSKR